MNKKLCKTRFLCFGSAFGFCLDVLRSLFPSRSPFSELEDPPPADVSDRDFGLHGYTLHVVMHNTSTLIMSGYFRQLSCHRGNLITRCQWVTFSVLQLKENQTSAKHRN